MITFVKSVYEDDSIVVPISGANLNNTEDAVEALVSASNDYETDIGTLQEDVGDIEQALPGLAPTDHASETTAFGVATATEYGHAMAGSEDPAMNGTASAGTDDGRYAREDHVHPVDTSRAPASLPNMPTADQKAALAGTSGTPSDTNRYVTNDSISRVFARYSTAQSYQSSANQPFNYSVKEIDTHNAVTTGASWKFTAPEDGLYSVQGVHSGGNTSTFIYKNGSVHQRRIAYATADPQFSTVISLVEGDYIDIRPTVSYTTPGSGDYWTIAITKVSL